MKIVLAIALVIVPLVASMPVDEIHYVPVRVVRNSPPFYGNQYQQPDQYYYQGGFQQPSFSSNQASASSGSVTGFGTDPGYPSFGTNPGYSRFGTNPGYSSFGTNPGYSNSFSSANAASVSGNFGR